MRAGRLDRRITIERYTESVNAYGEREQTWASAGKLWAALDLRQIKVKENEVGAQLLPMSEIVWRVRHSQFTQDITEKDRILWRGRSYDILGIHIMGRGEDVMITTKLRDTNG